jgi:hypothetical protein
MRNILTETAWLSIESPDGQDIKVHPQALIIDGRPVVLIRTATGHDLSAPADFESHAKQARSIAVGEWFMAHPDAKLEERDGEFRYSFTANGILQHTRWAPTPASAVLFIVA